MYKGVGGLPGLLYSNSIAPSIRHVGVRGKLDSSIAVSGKPPPFIIQRDVFFSCIHLLITVFCLMAGGSVAFGRIDSLIKHTLNCLLGLCTPVKRSRVMVILARNIIIPTALVFVLCHTSSRYQIEVSPIDTRRVKLYRAGSHL